MKEKDWDEKLRNFLKFNERDVLQHAGKISMEIASELAIQEYEKFHQQRLQADEKAESFQDDAFLESLTHNLSKWDTD